MSLHGAHGTSAAGPRDQSLLTREQAVAMHGSALLRAEAAAEAVQCHPVLPRCGFVHRGASGELNLLHRAVTHLLRSEGMRTKEARLWRGALKKLVRRRALETGMGVLTETDGAAKRGAWGGGKRGRDGRQRRAPSGTHMLAPFRTASPQLRGGWD